ncbi:ABC transporter permease [Roseomonas stagni]|uniref:ABC transporter permease n=1 Tax=Falsiroseomonas algicola TaxID=2716930 RepID=A0A6M1LSE6_9PROT|nr:ABC transporter permease [Falsiroseomonas algicola]NGM22514.1 ABC transporter permease [Falsiroseomonas algicola]
MTLAARRRLREALSPALFVAALLLAWEIASRALGISKFVAPKPSEILPIFAQRGAEILPHAAQTLSTTLAGFVVGVALGFALGVALGASRRFYAMVFPTLIGVNSIPKVAIVPLLVLWAGIGTVPAVVTSAVIVIFPIAVVVSASIATMDAELADVLRSLGASRLLALAKVGVPQSMPAFFGALKVAITLSFIGSILAESVAANRGLGFMMNRAASDFDVELVYSGLLTLAAMGIALYLASLALERRVVGWADRRG